MTFTLFFRLAKPTKWFTGLLIKKGEGDVRDERVSCAAWITWPVRAVPIHPSSTGTLPCLEQSVPANLTGRLHLDTSNP